MGQFSVPSWVVLLAVLLAWGRLTPVVPVEAGEPLTVVELFTSQGCPRCPPADAVLREISAQPGVLALSIHVDYWDYLGWRDPYATAEGTQRQRDYAARFGLRYVYTPQMVIQGVDHLPGTDPTEVLQRVADAASADQVSVSLERRGSEHLRVDVGARSSGQVLPADVWLVTFDRERSAEVQSGHNAGSLLRHANVVTGLRRIGTWGGQAHELQVRLSEAGPASADSAAVMVQAVDSGQIIGAAVIALPLRP
ncbi:MAG: DUF1223 domain-containing protein [Rhodospirillales bacterium]|nr:MAG: DUF1223 domain-containing protein [Rhodospirillales bacterium]